jgi:hypothetical protein
MAYFRRPLKSDLRCGPADPNGSYVREVVCDLPPSIGNTALNAIDIGCRVMEQLFLFGHTELA